MRQLLKNIFGRIGRYEHELSDSESESDHETSAQELDSGPMIEVMPARWTQQTPDEVARVLLAAQRRISSNARSLAEIIREAASGSAEDLEEERMIAVHARLRTLLKRKIKDGEETSSYTYALFQYLLGKRSCIDRRVSSIEIGEDDEYGLTLAIKYPAGYIDNVSREGVSPLIISVSLAEEDSEHGPRLVQKFTFNILQKQANGRYKTEQEVEEGFRNLEVFFRNINEEYEEYGKERTSASYALSEIKQSLKNIKLFFTNFPTAINNLDNKGRPLDEKRLPFKARWPKGREDVVRKLCDITRGTNFEFIKITPSGIEITADPDAIMDARQIYEGLIFDFVKLDEAISVGFRDREVEERGGVLLLEDRVRSPEEEAAEIDRLAAEIEGGEGHGGAAAGAGGSSAGAGSSSSRRGKRSFKDHATPRAVKALVAAPAGASSADYVKYEEEDGDGWFKIEGGKAIAESLEEAKKNLKAGTAEVTTSINPIASRAPNAPAVPITPVVPTTTDSPESNNHKPSVFVHKLLFLKKGVKVLGDFGCGVVDIVIPEDTLLFPTVKYYAPQGFVIKRVVPDNGMSIVEYDSIIPKSGGGKFLALKKDSVIVVINPDGSFADYKIGNNAVLVPCREVDKMLIESAKKDVETAAKMDIFNSVSDESNLTHQNILFLLRDTLQKAGFSEEQCDYNLSHGGISAAVISQDPALDYSLRNAMLDFLNQDPPLDRASIILGRGNLIKNEIEGNSHWTSLHLRRVVYGDRFIIQAYHIDSLCSREIPDAVTRVLNSVNNVGPASDLSEDDRARYQRAISRLSSSQYCFNGQCNAGVATIQTDNYSCGYHAAFNAVASYINDGIAAAPLNVILQDGKDVAIEEFIAEKKEILKQKFSGEVSDMTLTAGEDESKLTYKARILSIIIGRDDHLTKLEKLILLEQEIKDIKDEPDEAVLRLSSLQIEASYKKILSEYATSLKYSTKDVMVFDKEIDNNILLFLEELCSAKTAQNPEKMLPLLKIIEGDRALIYSCPEKLLADLNEILSDKKSPSSAVAAFGYSNPAEEKAKESFSGTRE